MQLAFRGLPIIPFNVAPNAGKNGLTQAIQVASGYFRVPRIAAGTRYKSSIGAPAAPVVALAGAGAGNVNNGTHSYKFVAKTAAGHSLPSAKSNVVTTAGGDGKVNVTLPGWTRLSLIYAYEVYRSTAGDAGPWKLLTTSYDPAGGTYLDNTADGGLGADAPSTDTSFPTLRLLKPRRIVISGDKDFCYRTGVTAPTAVVTDRPVQAGLNLFVNIPKTHEFVAIISRDGVSTGTAYYSVSELQQLVP